MNKATWDSIPKKDQELWDMISGESKQKILGYGMQRAKRTDETTMSMHIFEDDFGPPGEEVVGESTAPGDCVARTHEIPPPTLGPEASTIKKTSLIPKETVSKDTKKVSFSNGPQENGLKLSLIHI